MKYFKAFINNKSIINITNNNIVLSYYTIYKFYN